MKNRRDFLKIFGMTIGAGALAVGMGKVAAAVSSEVKVQPWQSRPLNADEKAYIARRNKELGKIPLNARDRVTCPEVLEAQKKDDTLKHWREVWAQMANPQLVSVGLDPTMQEKIVDNVFQSSPLMNYLTSTNKVDINTTNWTTTGGGGIIHTTDGTIWTGVTTDE